MEHSMESESGRIKATNIEYGIRVFVKSEASKFLNRAFNLTWGEVEDLQTYFEIELTKRANRKI